MTAPHRELADYCQWWPEGERRPCYAPATFVLTRPSGQTLGFSCPDHREAWATAIQGVYEVVERAIWEERGAGYQGKALGG